MAFARAVGGKSRQRLEREVTSDLESPTAAGVLLARMS